MAQTIHVNDLTHRRWARAIKLYATLLALALLALSAQMGYATWQSMRSAGADAAQPDALELSANARTLARLARAAMDGTEVAVAFGRTRSKIAVDAQALLARIKHTAPQQDSAGHLFSAWAETDTAAGQLHDQLTALQEMAAQYTHFFEQLPAIKTRLDELVRHMVSSGSAAPQVYLALHQLVLIDEMARQVDTIRSGGDAAALEAAELVQEIAAFERVLNGLRHGDTGIALRRLQGQKNLATLAQVEAQWAQLRPRLDAIAHHAPARLAAQSAVMVLERGADAMLTAASTLPASGLHPLPMRRPWGLASALLALLAGAGLWQAISRHRRLLNEQAAQLRHYEQNAFAQLLDEMGALAEGDLTVKATFSEDATGALADAINFIAQQLGARIQALTDAIAPMPVQADQARQMVIRLSEVSQYQTQELSAAEAKVQQMSARLDAVLALLAVPAATHQQEALDTARECAHLAADLTAMIETVHTVSTQLAGEAGEAVPALEALAQTAATLREAADGFILPS